MYLLSLKAGGSTFHFSLYLHFVYMLVEKVNPSTIKNKIYTPMTLDLDHKSIKQKSLFSYEEIVSSWQKHTN